LIPSQLLNIAFGTSVYDEVNNRLGIGTTTPETRLDIISVGLAAGSNYANNTTFNNTLDPPYWRTRASRGTLAVPASINAGDTIGGFLFLGNYGTTAGGTWKYGVGIFCEAEAIATTNGIASAIRILTNNGTTTSEKIRINSTGSLIIGNTTVSSVDVKLGIYNTADYATGSMYCYSATSAHYSVFSLVKSHNNTLGTLTPTVDTENIGAFAFTGVNNSNALTGMARIAVIQSGSAGASYNAADLIFELAATGTSRSEKMRLNSAGDLLTIQAKYHYMAQSQTADTVGDCRFYSTYAASVTTFFIQKCTVANAVKGSGTWTTINSFAL